MQKNCFSYPVEFIEDAFGDSPALADTLRAAAGGDDPRVLIVADLNVVQRVAGLGSRIGRYVQAQGIRLAGSPVVLGGGEKIKSDNLQSALKVMSAIVDNKLGQGDLVLALGGGTLLDVAGYASAQVHGGIRLVRMPTTPAAMLDAAYAERACIDSLNVKDVLSVSSVPAAVVIDAKFADSVLDGVWFGGFGEAVRLALMRDAALFKELAATAADYRARKEGVLAKLVSAVRQVRTKKGATDLAEWAAARLEPMSGYKLPHGYAIAIGIVIEVAYATEAGLIKAKDRDAVIKMLREGGALDGLAHSQYLLNQPDQILAGLEVWRRSHGDPQRELPTAPGKSKVEAEPDRGVYTAILNFDKISQL